MGQTVSVPRAPYTVGTFRAAYTFLARGEYNVMSVTRVVCVNVYENRSRLSSAWKTEISESDFISSSSRRKTTDRLAVTTRSENPNHHRSRDTSRRLTADHPATASRHVPVYTSKYVDAIILFLSSLLSFRPRGFGPSVFISRQLDQETATIRRRKWQKGISAKI